MVGPSRRRPRPRRGRSRVTRAGPTTTRSAGGGAPRLPAIPRMAGGGACGWDALPAATRRRAVAPRAAARGRPLGGSRQLRLWSARAVAAHGHAGEGRALRARGRLPRGPPAVAPPGYPRFLEWLEAGHAAGMHYLPRRADVRSHPERLLEGVRSVVVVSFVYGRPEPSPPTATQGKVARYARGADYHEVLW